MRRPSELTFRIWRSRGDLGEGCSRYPLRDSDSTDSVTGGGAQGAARRTRHAPAPRDVASTADLRLRATSTRDPARRVPHRELARSCLFRMCMRAAAAMFLTMLQMPTRFGVSFRARCSLPVRLRQRPRDFHLAAEKVVGLIPEDEVSGVTVGCCALCVTGGPRVCACVSGRRESQARSRARSSAARTISINRCSDQNREPRAR